MELFAVLIVVAVGVWFLMSPFIVFGLWNRLKELESSVKQLQLLGETHHETTHDLLTPSAHASNLPVVSPQPIPVPLQTMPATAATVAFDTPLETPVILHSP